MFVCMHACYVYIYRLKTKSRDLVFLFVLQVNGRDLTSASHEETVEAFQSASEPILVEVRRKNELAQMRRLTASKSTQTDENLRFDLSLLDATYSNAKP